MLALFTKWSISVTEFVAISGILRGFPLSEISNFDRRQAIKGFHSDTRLSDE